MKIGEARAAYGVCLRSYYDKQRELGKQKKALEEKINNTENGAVIYKNEAAIIELQYEAVNDKKNEKYFSNTGKELSSKEVYPNNNLLSFFLILKYLLTISLGYGLLIYSIYG